MPSLAPHAALTVLLAGTRDVVALNTLRSLSLSQTHSLTLERDWVCVWRGAGGRGDGGGAGWRELRGGGETATNAVCYQDFQE